jgi:acyl-CoA thioester hydrolase
MSETSESRHPVFRYRVYWEDTDAGGVVYHARYLHFLERARSDWLTALGVSQPALRAEHGLLFAVTHVDIDFRRPARLEDELDVSVRVQSIGRVRMDFAQEVVRGGDRLVSATVRAACLDARRFAPARLPPAIEEQIRGGAR